MDADLRARHTRIFQRTKRLGEALRMVFFPYLRTSDETCSILLAHRERDNRCAGPRKRLADTVRDVGLPFYFCPYDPRGGQSQHRADRFGAMAYEDESIDRMNSLVGDPSRTKYFQCIRTTVHIDSASRLLRFWESLALRCAHAGGGRCA